MGSRYTRMLLGVLGVLGVAGCAGKGGRPPEDPAVLEARRRADLRADQDDDAALGNGVPGTLPIGEAIAAPEGRLLHLRVWWGWETPACGPCPSGATCGPCAPSHPVACGRASRVGRCEPRLAMEAPLPTEPRFEPGVRVLHGRWVRDEAGIRPRAFRVEGITRAGEPFPELAGDLDQGKPRVGEPNPEPASGSAKPGSVCVVGDLGGHPCNLSLPAEEVTAEDQLLVTLVAQAPEVKPGGALQVTLRIENRTDRALRIRLDLEEASPRVFDAQGRQWAPPPGHPPYGKPRPACNAMGPCAAPGLILPIPPKGVVEVPHSWLAVSERFPRGVTVPPNCPRCSSRWTSEPAGPLRPGRYRLYSPAVSALRGPYRFPAETWVTVVR